MFTKWKSLTGELYYVSCPRSGKLWLGNTTVFHVHKVENFNWRDLSYFMSTMWKSLTVELYNISCPRVENLNWMALRYLMSTK